jgi:hypothetical protein
VIDWQNLTLSLFAALIGGALLFLGLAQGATAPNALLTLWGLTMITIGVGAGVLLWRLQRRR